MNISENNFKKLKTIINELMELSNKLPDISNNIVNTNINYRAFILNQWIENPNKDINYYINSIEIEDESNKEIKKELLTNNGFIELSSVFDKKYNNKKDNNNLFWWQKLIIKLLELKEKTRKTKIEKYLRN